MKADDPRRRFDDDPAFFDRLAELDRPTGEPSSEPAGAPEAGASHDVPPVPSLPPLTLRPGRRPLLEIFPPSATSGEEPPPEADVPSLPPFGQTARGTSVPGRFSTQAQRDRREPTRREPARHERHDFYRFTEPPFSTSTDPKFLFHSNAYERVSQEMLHAIRQRHGFVLLTGEAGLGKTIACRAVLDQLDHRTLTSLVGAPFDTTEALLKTVLVDFGVVSRAELDRNEQESGTRSELTLVLREFLQSLIPLDAFAVLVVDEADALNDEALEQLQRLSEPGDGPLLLQVVLVGTPALRDRLLAPALATLNGRVAVRCTHSALEPDEVGLYIAHRLHVATQEPTVVFEPEAVERVWVWSLGIPRAINLLCERALTHGRALDARVIDAALVDRAAGELGLQAPRTFTAARRALTAAIFLLLALVGAAVGAYVFRAELGAVLERWHLIGADVREPER